MNVYQKSLKLMTAREKRTGTLLLGLTFLKSIADTAGVAAILPFLSILGQPELVETNPYASRLYQAFGFTSVNDALFVLGMLVVLVLVISAILKVVTVYATNRWIEMREFGLSRRLLRTYFRQPYTYFLTRNTSKMTASILHEARSVTFGIYRQAINIFSAAISFCLIFALLVWANPLITTVSVLAIGTSYVLLYISLKGFAKRKGEVMVAANQSRIQRVNEAFAGIKQIKFSGLENFTLKLYSGPSKDLAQARAITGTMGQVPKFALEVIAFGGIIVLTLILFKKNDGAIEKVLPLLGLYAVATYRLIPVLQLIYNSVIALRLAIPAIDRVYEDARETPNLADIPQAVIEPMPLNNAIKFEAVHYAYPETSETGLRDVNLVIQKGESLGIVGTTGAGKTTLVDVLLGLLEISKGSIFIDDTRLDADNIRNWQASIGYVPQDIFLSDASVAENIAIGIQKDQISFENLKRAAKAAKLYEFIVDDLPNGFQTIIGERGVRLSGGQRQRLGIARALYHEPQIIVFDEATSALDNTTERELISEISQMGGNQTIVMIAHRLSTIKNCDQIVVLDKGTVVGKGTYKVLSDSSSIFRKMTSP